MRPICAGLIIATLLILGCSDDSAPLPRADGGTTADLSLSCDNLIERYRAFVAANKSCAGDSDCVVVGAVRQTCGCYPSLSGSGEGINISAKAEAEKFEDMFHYSFRCDKLRQRQQICDAAPGKVTCVGGACRVKMASCWQAPGPPADAGAGADAG